MDRRDELREQQSIARIDSLTLSFQPSSEVKPELHMKSLLGEAEREDKGAKFSKYASTWPTQLQVLMRRSWWQLTRDRLPLIIAFVQVKWLTPLSPWLLLPLSPNTSYACQLLSVTCHGPHQLCPLLKHQ